MQNEKETGVIWAVLLRNKEIGETSSPQLIRVN